MASCSYWSDMATSLLDRTGRRLAARIFEFVCIESKD
jgi:hypothetical protein